MSNEVLHATLFLKMNDSGGDENLIKIVERRSRLRSREPGHRYGTLAIIIRFEKRGMGICNGQIISSGTSRSSM